MNLIKYQTQSTCFMLTPITYEFNNILNTTFLGSVAHEAQVYMSLARCQTQISRIHIIPKCMQAQ